MIKAIIFDCDGTLVDSEHSHYLSWHHALSKWNIPFAEADYSTHVGKTGKVISENLCEQFQLDSSERLLKDKKVIYDDIMKNKAVPSIERTLRFVHDLIKRKESLSLKLGVASAAPKEEILLNLNFLGITEKFDVIVSGKDDLDSYHDEEGVNKPKPYVYLHAAKLLEVDPQECIAFEDSTSGVIAATEAGMFTVAVPNRFTKHHDFSLAHLIIEQSQEIVLENLLHKSHQF